MLCVVALRRDFLFSPTSNCRYSLLRDILEDETQKVGMLKLKKKGRKNHKKTELNVKD